MKCTKCGTIFEEGLFCPECGAKYDEEEAKLAEQKERERAEAERLAEEQRKEEEKVEKQKKREAELEKARLEQEKVAKAQEIELARAKIEQERLAKERAEQEAEVLRLKKEEAERKAIEKEKAKAEQLSKEERLSRTFNNVEYQTKEEAEAASIAYEREQERIKQQKKVDGYAIWSLVLGIASWPLSMLMVGVFLAIPAVIFGVKALKNKTTKKGCAIGGIVSAGIHILVIVLCLIFAFLWNN